jgi:hypothetical protein
MKAVLAWLPAALAVAGAALVGAAAFLPWRIVTGGSGADVGTTDTGGTPAIVLGAAALAVGVWLAWRKATIGQAGMALLVGVLIFLVEVLGFYVTAYGAALAKVSSEGGPGVLTSFMSSILMVAAGYIRTAQACAARPRASGPH